MIIIFFIFPSFCSECNKWKLAYANRDALYTTKEHMSIIKLKPTRTRPYVIGRPFLFLHSYNAAIIDIMINYSYNKLA